MSASSSHAAAGAVGGVSEAGRGAASRASHSSTDTAAGTQMMTATTTTTIRPMEHEAVRRIVTGQAILDLTSCVKELLDNAIDAGAKNINVRLFQQGLHIVEVSDDGVGVPASCRRLLATAHATSKIRSVREIGNTLGFRGEALHSLAALCEKLIIATRVDGEELAEKLEFRNDGTVDETATSRFSRKVGTTVAVLNFFQPIPVRRMHLKEQISNQRAKLVSMVESYAIFHPGVRIHLMDIVGRQCNERTVVSTAYNCTTLPETISSVLGSAFLESLCPVDLNVPELNLVVSGRISRARTREPSAAMRSRGMASLPTRKLFAINRRPVELPRLKRMLNEMWSRGKFVAMVPRDASWVIDLTIPIDQVDVNLSPDKRTVALKQEEQVFQCIASYVQELWTSHTAGQFLVEAQPELVQRGDVGSDSDDSSSSCADNASDADGKSRRVDDDSTSPSRFNRRYAFSHDVSKARLQHEFDDGRKRRREEGAEELDDVRNQLDAAAHELPNPMESATSTVTGPKRLKQLQITSFVPASTERSNATTNGSLEPVTPSPVTAASTPMNETPLTDHAKENSSEPVTSRIVSANKLEESAVEESCDAPRETHCDESPTDNDPPPNRLPRESSPPSSSPVHRTSWAEQAQWRLAQQAFNGTSSSASANAVASTGLEDDIRLVSDDSAPKFGFAQFGLNQPIRNSTAGKKDVASSEPARIEREGNRRATNENDRTLNRLSAGRRVSTTVNGSRIPQTNQGDGLHVACPPTAAQDHQVDMEDDKSPLNADSSGPSQDEVLSRTDDAAAEATTASPAAASSTEVTWDMFGTTHDVVMAARRERLALRDRKRAFDDSRKRLEESAIESSDSETRPPVAAASQFREGPATGSIQLRKEDFAGMSIVGQFNCGFILAKSPDNHLWILDQHACDEKANFEQLCEESAIREQRLVIPLPLELTLPEEMCVMDHLDVFEKNGFRFQIDSSKPPRYRLSLIALPQSGATDGRKSVVFGKDDVSALCAILGASGDHDEEGALSTSLADGAGTGVDGGGMYGNNAVRRHAGAGVASAPSQRNGLSSADKIVARLPKAIAMFASRACRSSIMIGKVLSAKEMERVVTKMKELVDPWTCAHGRPTIRHVADLHGVMGRDEARARSAVLCATTTLCSQQGDDDDDGDEESNESEEH